MNKLFKSNKPVKTSLTNNQKEIQPKKQVFKSVDRNPIIQRRREFISKINTIRDLEQTINKNIKKLTTLIKRENKTYKEQRQAASKFEIAISKSNLLNKNTSFTFETERGSQNRAVIILNKSEAKQLKQKLKRSKSLNKYYKFTSDISNIVSSRDTGFTYTFLVETSKNKSQIKELSKRYTFVKPTTASNNLTGLVNNQYQKLDSTYTNTQKHKIESLKKMKQNQLKDKKDLIKQAKDYERINKDILKLKKDLSNPKIKPTSKSTQDKKRKLQYLQVLNERSFNYQNSNEYAKLISTTDYTSYRIETYKSKFTLIAEKQLHKNFEKALESTSQPRKLINLIFLLPYNERTAVIERTEIKELYEQLEELVDKFVEALEADPLLSKELHKLYNENIIIKKPQKSLYEEADPRKWTTELSDIHKK